MFQVELIGTKDRSERNGRKDERCLLKFLIIIASLLDGRVESDVTFFTLAVPSIANAFVVTLPVGRAVYKHAIVVHLARRVGLGYLGEQNQDEEPREHD